MIAQHLKEGFDYSQYCCEPPTLALRNQTWSRIDSRNPGACQTQRQDVPVCTDPDVPSAHVDTHNQLVLTHATCKKVIMTRHCQQTQCMETHLGIPPPLLGSFLQIITSMRQRSLCNEVLHSFLAIDGRKSSSPVQDSMLSPKSTNPPQTSVITGKV